MYYLKINNNKIEKLSNIEFEGYTLNVAAENPDAVLTNFHVVNNELLYREIVTQGEDIISVEERKLDIY